ncbi:10740_t:CDS:2 [Gigaspora rosea]|nr:10740_t:CDS:2 [Gigaspora rosea]
MRIKSVANLYHFIVLLESYKTLPKANFVHISINCLFDSTSAIWIPVDFVHFIMNKKLDKFLTVNENPKDVLVINEANKESKHSDEIASDLVINKEVMNLNLK